MRGGMTVTVKGWPAVAWNVYQVRKGTATVVMVGDDQRHEYPVTDLTPVKQSDYCHTCGQLGCAH